MESIRCFVKSRSGIYPCFWPPSSRILARALLRGYVQTVIVLGDLAVLVVIVVLQNTQAVETRLLFVSITMPRAVLLLVSAVVGFALGVLVSLRVVRKKAQKPD